MELELKVKEFIKSRGLLEKGETVLLGVSGGADSTALLLAFLELKAELGIEIKVIHVEHGIRGKDSLEDAFFVEHLCEEYRIPFVLKKVNVPKFIKERGMSPEEAARYLRYKAFGEEEGVLATAHNAGDNAETIILNLVRGSGIEGLCGIAPLSVREGKRIIRPLLGCTRDEIEAYLKHKNQEYRIDKTNYSREYTRNIIRQDIIPRLMEINPKALDHINASGEFIKETVEFENSLVGDILKDAMEGAVLKTDVLKKLSPHLVKSVIKSFIKQETNGAHNIARVHYEAVCRLVNTEGSKRLYLPGYVLEKDYDSLKILSQEVMEPAYVPGEIIFDKNRINNELSVSFMDKTIYFKTLKCHNTEVVPKGDNLKWFDFDKLEDSISVRVPGEGDYLTINSEGNKKSYKRYCIDNKIPKAQREAIPVFACGKHIVWVLGHRISEFYKVTDTTKTILEVRVDER